MLNIHRAQFTIASRPTLEVTLFFATWRIFGRSSTLLNQSIKQAVWQADFCIAVIGEKWLSIQDKIGSRRIDDPSNFFRVELETAITIGIPIIPVLVGGAKLLSADRLPESLCDIATLNALTLRGVSDFSSKSVDL